MEARSLLPKELSNQRFSFSLEWQHHRFAAFFRTEIENAKLWSNASKSSVNHQSIQLRFLEISAVLFTFRKVWKKAERKLRYYIEENANKPGWELPYCNHWRNMMHTQTMAKECNHAVFWRDAKLTHTHTPSEPHWLTEHSVFQLGYPITGCCVLKQSVRVSLYLILSLMHLLWVDGVILPHNLQAKDLQSIMMVVNSLWT